MRGNPDLTYGLDHPFTSVDVYEQDVTETGNGYQSIEINDQLIIFGYRAFILTKSALAWNALYVPVCRHVGVYD